MEKQGTYKIKIKKVAPLTDYPYEYSITRHRGKGKKIDEVFHLQTTGIVRYKKRKYAKVEAEAEIEKLKSAEQWH